MIDPVQQMKTTPTHLSRIIKAVLLICAVVLTHQSSAFHIMGGDMTYRYIGTSGTNIQYSVKMEVYADRTQGGWNLGNPNDPGSGQPVRLDFNAYSADNNIRVFQTSFQSPGNGTTIAFANPELPANCTGVTTCLSGYVVTRSSVTFTVTLPFTFNGYYFLYGDRTRNASVTNLQNPTSLGMAMYQSVPGPQYANSSPQFTDSAVPVLFKDDTTYFVNGAFDPDGDRLEYEFTSALNAANTNPATWTVPANCPYLPQFSFDRPLGISNGSEATINRTTGLTKYVARAPGQYVCAIAIKEYRQLSNGTELLIGTTRRELQLIVVETGNQPGQCPTNATPIQLTTIPTQITVTQGQTVTFPVQYRDPDNNIITLTASGSIVDGSNGYTGPRAAFNPLNGTTAQGTFTWNTNCSVPANTYAVTISAKDNGCPPKTSVHTVNITVLRFTGPTSINGTTSPCSGGSSQTAYWVAGGAAPSGVTRQWKVSGGTIVRTSTNRDSVFINWTGNGFVRLVSTNSIGCKDSVSLTTTPSVVNPVVASNNTLICAGATSTLSATGGNNSFTWTTTTGIFVGTGSSVTVSPATTTSYVVSSTIGSCIARDTVVVTVVPRVTQSPDVVGCGTYANRIGSTALTGYTYNWSGPVGVVFVDPTTTANPRITVATPGLYQLTLVATQTANSCISRDTVLVRVNPQPQGLAYRDSTFCSGSVVTIGPLTAESGVTYNWANTTGFITGTATTARPIVQLTNTGSTTLVVAYPVVATFTATGCQRLDTVRLRVLPLPAANFSQDVSTCPSQNTVIGPVATPGFTYSWSPATNLSATNVAQPNFNDPTISATQLVRTYLLTVTGSNGCVDTFNVRVRVNPQPAVNAGRDIELCSGLSGQIGTAGQLALTYSWSPVTGLSNPNFANPTVTLTNNGTTNLVQQYILTATNPLTGCTKNDTVLVTVKPAEVANAGLDKEICSNVPITIGTPAQAGYTYSWAPATNLNATNVAQPVFTGVNTNSTALRFTYVLTLTNTTTGCTDTDTMVVQLNGTVSGSRLNAALCSRDTNSVGTNSLPDYTYSWTPAALFQSPNSSRTRLVNSVNPGSTPIVVNAFRNVLNTVTGCSTQDTVTITINPLPVSNAGADINVCANVAGQLGAASQPGLTYAWSPTTGLSNATVSNPTVTLANTGTTNIVQQYVVTTTNTTTGCRSQDTVVVTVLAPEVANAGVDKEVCSNVPLTIGEPAVPGYTYSWSPATNLSATNIAQPVFTATNTTTSPQFFTYVLTWTNTTTGCIDTDTMQVQLNGAVFGTRIDTAFCSGDTTGVGTAALPNYTYNWVPAALFRDPTAARAHLVNSTNATQTPLVITAFRNVLNTVNGCTTQDTVTITINPLPLINAGADTSVCTGSSFVRGEASQPGFTYNWSRISNPSGARFSVSDTTIGNPTFTVVNTGTSDVTIGFSVTKTNVTTGCSRTDTINFTSYASPQPVAYSADTATICSGDTIGLGIAALPNHVYSWSPATGLSSTTVSNPTLTRTITGQAVQTYQYVLTVNNTLTGCVATDTVVLRVLPLPEVTLLPEYVTCSGAPVQLGEPAVTGWTYQWLTSSFIDTSSKANPVYVRTIANGSPQAVENLTLRVTNVATGCVADFNTVVRVNSNPVSNAGTDVTICSGDTATIGAPSTSGLTYRWLTTQGVADTNAALTTVSRENLTNNPRQDVLVIRTTNTATGCTSTDTVLLTVNPRPVISNIIAGSNTVCPDVTGLLYSVPTEAGTTYAWTVNGGTIAAGQGSNEITVNWGPTFPNAFVRVVATNQYGCSGDTIDLPINIKIQLEPRKPVGDTLICSAQNTISYFTGATVGSAYTWFWSYDSAGTNVVKQFGPTTNQVSIKWPQIGKGKVWVFERSVSASNTCEGTSDTTYIEVFPSPDSTLQIQGPAQVCEKTNGIGYSIQATAGSTYAWTLTGRTPNPADTIVSGQGTNAITINAHRADTLVITVTETTDKGCVGKTIVDTVIVNPLPVVVVGTVDSTCAGIGLVLGATPQAIYSYKWTPSTGLNDDTLANPVLTRVAGTYKYYLQVTNRLTGCTNRDSISIQVNPLPITDAGSDKVVCSAEPTTIGTPKRELVLYHWSAVNGLAAGLTGGIVGADTSSAVANVVLTNSLNVPVWQRFALRTQDSLTKCFNYDTLVVRVNPLPIATAFGADTVKLCSTVPQQIGVTAVDSFRYRWTAIPAVAITGLSSDTVANPILTLEAVGSPTTIVYVVTVTNRLSGCVKTDTVTAITTPLPVITRTALDSICANGSKQLVVGVGANVTVSWSPSIGLNRTDSNVVTVSLPNSGSTPLTQRYYITATDTISGCVSRDSIDIKVNPLPRAFAGNDQVVCSKSVITLGEAPIAGNTYSWQPGNGLTGGNLTVANPTFQVLNATNAQAVYTYILTVTSPSGCVKSDTVAITVEPQPNTTLQTATVTCSGQTTALTNLVGVTGRTYQWSPADSLSDPTAANPSVRRSITGSVPQTFVYQLVTTITATGCKDTANVTLTVNPLPIIEAGTNFTVCATDSVRLGANAAVTGQTYNWQITNTVAGVVATLGSPTAAQPNFGATNTTGQPQRVTLLLTATIPATGCTTTDTTSVLVNPLPNVVANPVPTVTICSNGTAQLGVAPTAGFTYSWSPGTGLSNVNVSNPTITLTNSTQTVQRIRYTLTVTNQLTGCTKSDTVQIVVNPAPLVNVGSVGATCSNVPVTLGAAPVVGYTYSWSPATGLSATNVANPTFVLANPTQIAQTLTFKLVVTNAATGCKDSALLNMTVNPLPIAVAGTDKVVCSREQTSLGAAPVTGLVYSWAPTLGLSSTVVANPDFRLSNTTGSAINLQYILTVTNATTNCVSTDTVNVLVNPEPVTLRQQYDSTLCPQTINGRVYTVSGLAGSQYRWWVTGGALQGGVQNGVLTANNSVTINWDSTASSYSLKVLEVSQTSCQADTVNFPIFFNRATIEHLAVTQNVVTADTALYILYKIRNIGNLPVTNVASVYRRRFGTTDAFVLVGTTPVTDSVFVDRPAGTNQFVYEYFMTLANLCGTTTSSGLTQTNLRLLGQGDNANQTSNLSWNPYLGWAEGVERYEIYRKLDTDLDWPTAPYATVAGNATNWWANNGTDAFRMTYRIVAVRGGGRNTITAASNEVVIDFENALSKYNTITPNEDGKNDVFVIDNLKLYGKHDLRIFNRQGTQVYHTEDYKQDWKAENLPAGTYFYILKIEGDRAQAIKGWIQVLK